MGCKKFLVIVLCIFFMPPAIGTAQEQNEAVPSKSEGKVTAPQVAGKNMEEARENFLLKDLKGSAAAIKRAAAELKAIEGKAEERRAKDFLAGSEELKNLAERVENGAVQSVSELDRAFSRAFHALAEYHFRQAMESWGKKEIFKTGEELKTASALLERGFRQAGEGAEAGARAIAADTHLLGEKMIKGVGWARTEVEKGLKDLEGEIDRLGEKVKAKRG